MHGILISGLFYLLLIFQYVFVEVKGPALSTLHLRLLITPCLFPRVGERRHILLFPPASNSEFKFTTLLQSHLHKDRVSPSYSYHLMSPGTNCLQHPRMSVAFRDRLGRHARISHQSVRAA